jgi:uroporphyrinogen decarboxylase
VFHPLAAAETIADIERFDWPRLEEVVFPALPPGFDAQAAMDPAALKRDFGKLFCFHGGMETQGVLLNGTPAEVRQEVRHLAEVLGPDGYISTSSHNLQPDVPLPNIVAMYEELRSFGNSVGSALPGLWG